MRRLALMLALAVPGGCAGVGVAPVAAPGDEAVASPSAYFPKHADATAMVAAAKAEAAASGRRVLVVFGGDWCHDSRALMGWLAEPGLRDRVAAAYVVVPVDVGMKDRNIDVARGLGLDGIAGTPTMLMLAADGTPLNLAEAGRWRNAHAMGQAALEAALFPAP